MVHGYRAVGGSGTLLISMDTGQGSNEERSLAPTLDSWYLRTWARRKSLQGLELGLGAPAEGYRQARPGNISVFILGIGFLGRGAGLNTLIAWE